MIHTFQLDPAMPDVAGCRILGRMQKAGRVDETDGPPLRQSRVPLDDPRLLRDVGKETSQTVVSLIAFIQTGNETYLNGR